ncbi:MAG: hypothetical protein EA442_05820 [Candidatus Nitrosopelagicus sp.]|nr:MAG: hypothetical protein EA442_05820 [Candidatus Nitrosopelagicus sp.]
MLKDYLQLVRFPGIFTAFSNVLIGYFFSLHVNPESFSLPYLLVTSGMLFSAGMIFNDFFDINIDKKERPDRPLPSKKISKQNALFLGITLIVIANIFALFVGYYTLILSISMTIIILLYNYKLKFHSFFGIFSLSGIRFSNILLGFSILPFSIETFQYAFPVAIFVCGISILAKDEANSIKSFSVKINKIFNIITISYVFILIINNFQFVSLMFLSLFSILSLNLFYKNHSQKSNVQKYVTFQLLSIILLDATLISIISSYYFAILVSLLLIPSYVITRKLYLT